MQIYFSQKSDYNSAPSHPKFDPPFILTSYVSISKNLDHPLFIKTPSCIWIPRVIKTPTLTKLKRLQTLALALGQSQILVRRQPPTRIEMQKKIYY